MSDRRRIGLYIGEKMYQRLRRAAYIKGASQSQLLREALSKHLTAVEALDHIEHAEKQAMADIRRDEHDDAEEVE